MASLDAFNRTVAARTRAAEQILRSPELLALYKALGGLDDDLTKVASAGRNAEALSQRRSGTQAEGGAASLIVLQRFADLQRDYVAVMAVVQAVRGDLVEAGAAKEVVAAVDRILVNECPVVIRTIEAGEGGAKKKLAVRSKAQEAVRAEIQKDAAALLALDAVHPLLANRTIDEARLAKLRDAAQALAGKLAERAVKKGAGKASTAALREAVADQKRCWGKCYRILALAGQQDERVGQLLREAARKG
jgi:hypothetical protein